MKIGLFQGTFDPITKGHINCIKRAAKLCDKLYVLMAINLQKKTYFTEEERLQMIKECVKDIPNVEVDSFGGMTVDYAKSKNVNFFIRGLRDVADFDYEKKIEKFNKDMDGDIETIYITNDLGLQHVSSSGVRELINYNKDISMYVEEPVIKMLNKKKEGR